MAVLGLVFGGPALTFRQRGTLTVFFKRHFGARYLPVLGCAMRNMFCGAPNAHPWPNG
jgi:hypothetical protein